MSRFVCTEGGNPLLYVEMTEGERIFCEAGALVMMESSLDMDATATGGLLRSLTRNLFTGETFFQQSIHAARGDGTCVLAPPFPGGIMVLEDDVEYRLNTGAYLASSDGVRLTTRMQTVGNALFGGTGGFIVLESSGQGSLAVCGFGDLFVVDVEPNTPLVVDNEHVVAWSKTLEYEIAIGTSSRSGWVRNLFNFAAGGEGILLHFEGTGKVITQSRSLGAWQRLASPPSRNRGA